MSEEHVVGDIDRGTRKRKRNVTSKERKTEIRYSDPDPHCLSVDFRCNHKAKKFQCSDISISAIKYIKENFYAEKNKTAQDNKLAQMMEMKNTKRRKQRKNGKVHDFHVEYYVSIFIVN